MANRHHLIMIQNGVAYWNQWKRERFYGVTDWDQWKKEHRFIMGKLGGADLHGRDLRGVDFREPNLHVPISVKPT
jgi:hypothetical protein